MCILYTTICLLFLSYAFLDGFLFGTPYMTENNIKIKLAIAYLFPDYISLGQLFFNGWLILECIVFVVLSTYLCGFCVSESLLHCSTFEYTVPLIRDWFHHLFFFVSFQVNLDAYAMLLRSQVAGLFQQYFEFHFILHKSFFLLYPS